ncbi:MAG: biotin/lipoyl-containing protein, partial [Alphaproteobacteria bacterium]
DGPGYRLIHGGVNLGALVLSPRAAQLHALMPEKVEPDTSKLLLSPMPGLLKAVLVEAGDQVEPGQALAMVEAMKMENVLRAEKTATVATIDAAEGDSLAADQVILTFEG